jgi:hypothetical protein
VKIPLFALFAATLLALVACTGNDPVWLEHKGIRLTESTARAYLGRPFVSAQDSLTTVSLVKKQFMDAVDLLESKDQLGDVESKPDLRNLMWVAAQARLQEAQTAQASASPADEARLQAYYAAHTDLFVAPTRMVKIRYICTSTTVPVSFDSWFRSTAPADLNILYKWASSNARNFILDDAYHDVAVLYQLAALTQPNMFNQLLLAPNYTQTYKQTVDGKELTHFLILLESKEPGQPLPYDAVKNDIRRLLHLQSSASSLNASPTQQPVS